MTIADLVNERERQRARIAVPVRFPERPLGLEVVGPNAAFDDDLGVRRHLEVDGLASDGLERLAEHAARNRERIGRLVAARRRGQFQSRIARGSG